MNQVATDAGVTWKWVGKWVRTMVPASQVTIGSSDAGDRAAPRRIGRKLGQLQAGTSAAIRSVSFGDSLAGFKSEFVLRELSMRIGATVGRQPTSVGAGYDTSPYANIVAGTFSSNAGDLYAYWPTGPLNQITNTSRVSFLSGGVDPTFSRMKVYYVKESGAGIMKLTITPDGGAQTDVQTINAANATVALGVYEFVQTRGKSKFELIGVSGNPIRIIGVTDTGLENFVYQFMVGKGGANLTDMMSGVNSRALFTAFLADYAPDVAFFEMDEIFLDADLELLRLCWANGQPTADKIFIATTPQVTIPTSPARRDKLRDWVAACDSTHFFFDGWAPVAPYQRLVDLGWEGDGVHINFVAQAYLASILADKMGFTSSVYGYSTRGVNSAADQPSYFGSGTTVKSKEGGLAIAAESTFGYDMTISLPRSLSFETRIGGNGAAGWCIAGTAGFENSLPSGLRLGGKDQNRGWGNDSNNGWYRFNFDDASHANGGMVIKMGGLMFNTWTVATLPAANSRGGMVVGCTDASPAGAFRLVFSDGTSWLRVHDNKAPGSAL